MYKILLIIFISVSTFIIYTGSVRAQVPPYKDIKSIAYAFPDPVNIFEPWLTFSSDVAKIKTLGFNSVWFFIPWHIYEPQAFPAATYSDSEFNNLKTMLSLLRQNNMKAILPLNYIWGGTYHPTGVDELHWLRDPTQYAAFENYVKEFLTRISDYSDMVYILFFDEATNNNIDPYSIEQHALLLRSTLGSLPDRLPQVLRNNFRIGFHDGTFFFNQNFTPGESAPISPISSATTFDFFSGVNYYTFLGYDDLKIISILDKQIVRFKQYYPNLPLIIGEFGASSCPSYGGNEDKQASTNKGLISHFLASGYGFNLWGLKSLAPPADCITGSIDGGLGLYYSNGSPKKAVNEIQKILNSSYLSGDIDHNDRVDIYDYGFLIQNFGKTRSQGFTPSTLDPDIVRNDIVDIYDYGLLVQNFGKTQ